MMAQCTSLAGMGRKDREGVYPGVGGALLLPLIIIIIIITDLYSAFRSEDTEALAGSACVQCVQGRRRGD